MLKLIWYIVKAVLQVKHHKIKTRKWHGSVTLTSQSDKQYIFSAVSAHTEVENQSKICQLKT